MEQIINKKIKLNLVGMDSNSFKIMANFGRQAKREGWTQDEIDKVLDEAKAGDYDHLLQTIMAHTQ